MNLEADFQLAIERGHIGLAHLDAGLIVIARHGLLSQWLPPEGNRATDAPVLFGQDEDLLRLPQTGGRLTLPGIHVAEFGEVGRADVIVEWDGGRQLYLVATMANFEAGEIEALLTAERRNKQMSDERLLAETERANIQTRINAVAQERARIARDLHDTLIQTMIGLLTQVRLAQRIVFSDPERAAAILGQTEELARHGLDDAREALGAIRSQAHDSTTLGAMIRHALSQLRARLNIVVDLHMDAAADDLRGDAAHALARIVEEGLRNIERHARANSLELVLKMASADSGRQLVLKLADDGVGFEAGDRFEGHFGLTGMREQADLLGADIEIDTAPGKGTRICVELPVPGED